MKLNKRVQILILPVLFTSFLLIAVGLYLVERHSVHSLNRSAAELEATELAASFTQYSLVAKGFLASLIQSDALRYFLDSKDEHFKSLALSGGLDGILNNLTDLSSDHFSITFLRGDGSLEYYYENSLDPFSSPDPQLQQWAIDLARKGVSNASHYFVEKEQIVYCRILDRLTLKPPLQFETNATFSIIIALRPNGFLKRGDELAQMARTMSFRDEKQPMADQGPFEARRLLPGFGSISVQIHQAAVEKSLKDFFLRLLVGFVVLTGLTHIVLQWLIGRYVIKPINHLEQQLGNVDLDATQELEVYHSRDEIGSLSLAFAGLYEKLKETYEATRELAERDTLTALYNRRVFNLTLQKLIKRAEVNGGNVGLLYIDIDNFKYVNDHYGHTIGDELLRSFALRLHEVVRGDDLIFEPQDVRSTVARLAGDEFAIIINGFTGDDATGKIARRVLEICENGFETAGTLFPISLSIGVAAYPKDGSTVDELIVNADSAMYQSKKSGKNMVSFFSAGQWETAKRQQVVEMHLKNLDVEELELYYMPIVAAENGRIHAFEALLRWSSKSLGPVPPAEFIPLAESLGVYKKIDLWVLERAFLESAALRERFGQETRVSINISAAELSQNDFVESVFQLVRRHGIDPALFTIEITETFYQDHSIAADNLLRALSDAGFHLAIDDLGSGYSSLLQLVEFPISMVKFDRVFISRSIAKGQVRVLKSLVDLCHVQGVAVTAEGVEDSNVREQLKDAGCDYLQGYLFSKPLSLHEIILLPGNHS